MARKKNFIQKIYEGFFIRQWTIGFFNGDIRDTIKSKSFNPDIQWLPIEPFHRFFADPFFYRKSEATYNVMVEEFDIRKEYGKISLLTFDESLKIINEKILLDTQSHLSYPFIFEEDNKIYVFPEAGKSGKLSCYEFNPEDQMLTFSKTIIELPVMDPTIVKHNNKYWLFGTLSGKDARSKLFIFFSDNIKGPYKEHLKNPVKDSLHSSRSAGNFISVDGTLYRPSQNCENYYGESIIINKLIALDEMNYKEEPYMEISINKKNRTNRGIRSIHTINAFENVIVVDGQKWAFFFFSKIKYKLIKYLRIRRKTQVS